MIDVREEDELDTGYIPGSLDIPYRLVADVLLRHPADRPVVTICDTASAGGDRRQHPASARGTTRARSWTAASVEWRARGGDTVAFRRLGSA